MGQSSSKRRSYTPNAEAGVSSRSNGSKHDGKANGNIEVRDDHEVSGGTKRGASTSPTSGTYPEEKEKRKRFRIGFSLRRTPSGRWTRKKRSAAQNGGKRPLSCPLPVTHEQNENSDRPQSLFLDELEIQDDNKHETVDLSDHEDGKAKSKGGTIGVLKPSEKSKGKRGSKVNSSGRKKKKEKSSKKEKDKKKKQKAVAAVETVKSEPTAPSALKEDSVLHTEVTKSEAAASAHTDELMGTTKSEVTVSALIGEPNAAATITETSSNGTDPVAVATNVKRSPGSEANHHASTARPTSEPDLEAIAASIVAETVAVAQERLKAESTLEQSASLTPVQEEPPDWPAVTTSEHQDDTGEGTVANSNDKVSVDTLAQEIINQVIANSLKSLSQNPEIIRVENPDSTVLDAPKFENSSSTAAKPKCEDVIEKSQTDVSHFVETSISSERNIQDSEKYQIIHAESPSVYENIQFDKSVNVQLERSLNFLPEISQPELKDDFEQANLERNIQDFEKDQIIHAESPTVYANVQFDKSVNVELERSLNFRPEISLPELKDDSEQANLEASGMNSSENGSPWEEVSLPKDDSEQINIGTFGKISFDNGSPAEEISLSKDDSEQVNVGTSGEISSENGSPWEEILEKENVKIASLKATQEAVEQGMSDVVEEEQKERENSLNKAVEKEEASNVVEDEKKGKEDTLQEDVKLDTEIPGLDSNTDRADKENTDKQVQEKEMIRQRKEDEKAQEKERIKEEKKKKAEQKAAEKAEKEKTKEEKKFRGIKRLSFSNLFHRKKTQTDNNDASNSLKRQGQAAETTTGEQTPAADIATPLNSSLSVDLSVEPFAQTHSNLIDSSHESCSNTNPTSPERTISPEDSAPGEPVFPNLDVEKNSEKKDCLKKISLGPRLRTAILRTKSGGNPDTESEGKKLSLTTPKVVDSTEITPPPRKSRARKLLSPTTLEISPVKTADSATDTGVLLVTTPDSTTPIKTAASAIDTSILLLATPESTTPVKTDDSAIDTNIFPLANSELNTPVKTADSAIDTSILLLIATPESNTTVDDSGVGDLASPEGDNPETPCSPKGDCAQTFEEEISQTVSGSGAGICQQTTDEHNLDWTTEDVNSNIVAADEFFLKPLLHSELAESSFAETDEHINSPIFSSLSSPTLVSTATIVLKSPNAEKTAQVSECLFSTVTIPNAGQKTSLPQDDFVCESKIEAPISVAIPESSVVIERQTSPISSSSPDHVDFSEPVAATSKEGAEMLRSEDIKECIKQYDTVTCAPQIEFDLPSCPPVCQEEIITQSEKDQIANSLEKGAPSTMRTVVVYEIGATTNVESEVDLPRARTIREYTIGILSEPSLFSDAKDEIEMMTSPDNENMGDHLNNGGSLILEKVVGDVFCTENKEETITKVEDGQISRLFQDRKNVVPVALGKNSEIQQEIDTPSTQVTCSENMTTSLGSLFENNVHHMSHIEKDADKKYFHGLKIVNASRVPDHGRLIIDSDDEDDTKPITLHEAAERIPTTKDLKEKTKVYADNVDNIINDNINENNNGMNNSGHADIMEASWKLQCADKGVLINGNAGSLIETVGTNDKENACNLASAVSSAVDTSAQGLEQTKE